MGPAAGAADAGRDPRREPELDAAIRLVCRDWKLENGVCNQPDITEVAADNQPAFEGLRFSGSGSRDIDFERERHLREPRIALEEAIPRLRADPRVA